MLEEKTVTIIVAMDRNRVIGVGGDLPWHLPADLRQFKANTVGKTIVMGRKTYESIGRPLPDRQNIVLSRQADWQAEGCERASTLKDAARMTIGPEMTVIGGGDIYRLALAFADRLLITEVDCAVEGGDATFPEVVWDQWTEVSRQPHVADERHAHAFCFVGYERS